VAAPGVSIDLDHLALAAQQAFDNFARYYGELGGRPGFGGIDPGFHFSQLHFPTPGGGTMALELLEPRDRHLDDFLQRFLDRNGPGPHHLTYKVSDLRVVLAAAEAAGCSPVGVDLSDPSWQVGYLHPKEAHGVVVQLARSDSGAGDDERPPPDPLDLAPAKVAEPAELRRVVLTVADPVGAENLFGSVLGGQVAARGDDDLGPWTDLRWPGGGVVRLTAPTGAAARAWVGGRPGRVHHLLLATTEPGLVSGARPRPGEDRAWELPPELNLGTRLRLVRR